MYLSRNPRQCHEKMTSTMQPLRIHNICRHTKGSMFIEISELAGRMLHVHDIGKHVLSDLTNFDVSEVCTQRGRPVWSSPLLKPFLKVSCVKRVHSLRASALRSVSTLAAMLPSTKHRVCPKESSSKESAMEGSTAMAASSEKVVGTVS